ncbi:Zn-ribbon domain-containing OB-fold protein [Sphingopyxis kveilinensis]|uniref:Zn-ribbon domain-containing OB-fold protein n=1 Tax=Sphingopyxis kveilinensis TaxID=3114367 RepID=UPI0030D30D30
MDLNDVTVSSTARPIVGYLKVSKEGEPYLCGTRCESCGEIFLGPRRACGRCGGQDFAETRLAPRGRLYNYTVVHRSFPGVPTPFVSAIVELDGGGVIKGTLEGVPPRHDAVHFDMPVRLVFKEIAAAGADEEPFLGFSFQPL